MEAVYIDSSKGYELIEAYTQLRVNDSICWHQVQRFTFNCWVDLILSLLECFLEFLTLTSHNVCYREFKGSVTNLMKF